MLMNINIANNSLENKQADSLIEVANTLTDSQKTEVGKNFDEEQNKVDPLELWDQKISPTEMHALRAILDSPNDKMNYRKIINDMFGYDINKNDGDGINALQAKENKKFFGALLYDISIHYKQNRSSTEWEDGTIQEEKKLLDVAKILLMLMGVSSGNPYKQLESPWWWNNYAVIEKSLMREASQKEVSMGILSFEEARNKKIIEDNWYDLIKEAKPYVISKQGKQMSKEDQDAFASKWFSITEQVDDKRETQEPMHEKYNLPENIIDMASIWMLPGFKELEEKIQNPDIRIKEVNIIGMASHIPTDLNPKIFAYMDSKGIPRPDMKEQNNVYLSEARALIAKDRIQNVLQKNAYDINTVTIVTSNKVDGPAWETRYNDASLISDREKIYHPYQGVDFNVTYEQKQNVYNYTLERKVEWPQDDMQFRLTTEVIVPQSLLNQNKIVVKDNSGNKLESEYILLQLSSNAKAIPWINASNRNFSTIAKISTSQKMKNAINAGITDSDKIELNSMQQWEWEKVSKTPVLYVDSFDTFNEINDTLVKGSFTDNQAARMMKRLLKEQAEKWWLSSI